MPAQSLLTGLALEATVEKRFGTPGTPKLAASALVSTAGNTDIITPPAGKKVRVLWVSAIPSSDNTASPLITVKYETSGTMYLTYAVAHWELFEGAVNEKVQVNLNMAGQAVAVTIHYELF